MLKIYGTNHIASFLITFQVITASGRQVTLADQEASNGVIHEVSGVLIPPPGTITAVVKKCPAFSTLLKAVSEVPDIVTTLDGNKLCPSIHVINKNFKQSQSDSWCTKQVLFPFLCIIIAFIETCWQLSSSSNPNQLLFIHSYNFMKKKHLSENACLS